MRLPIVGALLLALLTLWLISASVVSVPENQQALIVRFGRPDRTVNAYSPREPIGQAGAGLALVMPFVESVRLIDKRISDLDMPEQQVLSTDQQLLSVNAFARYRIVNPLRMYETRGTEEAVRLQLTTILSSRLRNELGKMPFQALLSPERSAVMGAILADVNREARGIGAELIDLRIKKADLPAGTPLDGAYDRMRSARQQQAATIRARGTRQAQIVFAQADADAAQIYAKSFGADPQFYAFYRAMQAYERSFGKGNATLVLSPDNAFLKEFEGGKER